MVKAALQEKTTAEKAAPLEPFPRSSPSQPTLTEDFWRALAEQPRCKIDGICDGCGRCEH